MVRGSLLLVFVLPLRGFAVLPSQNERAALTRVRMGKSNSRNKQADLLRKMEMAKQQHHPADEVVPEGDKQILKLTDKQIEEQNDQLRFKELLKQSATKDLKGYSSDGYLNAQQEKEEMLAQRAGADRIVEGDPAPVECFAELVSIKTEAPIGLDAAERLVPWTGKTSHKHDFLVCFADPRPKSPELRKTMKKLLTDLPPDELKRLIIINSDSPAENRRWLKRNGLWDKLQVYSDEKMEWMQAYTALGEKRWSMSMFLIADELVQKLAREVDVDRASRTILNAVNQIHQQR